MTHVLEEVQYGIGGQAELGRIGVKLFGQIGATVDAISDQYKCLL